MKETNEPLPLKSLNIDVEVNQSIASYVMTQKYENTSENPLEIVFIFPMDVDYAISKMEIEFKLEDGST